MLRDNYPEDKFFAEILQLIPDMEPKRNALIGGFLDLAGTE